MKPIVLLAAVLAIAACQADGPPAKLNSGEAFFVEQVKPVLERNCLRCHSGPKPPAGLDLGSRETAFAARRHGRPVICPCRPDHSLLVAAISRPGNHPKLMPQLVLSLSDGQIGAIREWIEDGAAWPAGPAGHLSAVPNPENP